MLIHCYTRSYVALSETVDDFGNIVKLQSFDAILGLMDFILSGE